MPYWNTSNQQVDESSLIMGSLDQKEISATRSVRLAQGRMMYDDDGGGPCERGERKRLVIRLIYCVLVG